MAPLLRVLMLALVGTLVTEPAHAQQDRVFNGRPRGRANKLAKQRCDKAPARVHRLNDRFESILSRLFALARMTQMRRIRSLDGPR